MCFALACQSPPLWPRVCAQDRRSVIYHLNLTVPLSQLDFKVRDGLLALRANVALYSHNGGCDEMFTPRDHSG